MNRAQKMVVVLVVGLTVLMGPSLPSEAKSGGIAGYSTSGCTCHSPGASPDVTVALTGPTTVEGGSTSTYSVTVTGGPLAANGLDLSVTDGTLVVTDTEHTQLVSGEIVQTTQGQYVTTWSFDWTAPTASTTVTMSVAALSGDGDGKKDSDDLWNLDSLQIAVTETPPPPGVPFVKLARIWPSSHHSSVDSPITLYAKFVLEDAGSTIKIHFDIEKKNPQTRAWEYYGSVETAEATLDPGVYVKDASWTPTETGVYRVAGYALYDSQGSNVKMIKHIGIF